MFFIWVGKSQFCSLFRKIWWFLKRPTLATSTECYITYCLICGLKSSLRPKMPQRNNFLFLLTDISSIMYCSFFILSGGSELGKMKIMNHGCLWAEGREGSRQCQLPSNCDSRLLLLSNHSTSNLCHCQRVRATTKLQVACAGV